MELKIKDLGYRYGSRVLFQNVSFSLNSGEILTILGVNGAGKTTLIRCVMQFISNYNGSIEVDGISLKTISIRKRADIIGYVASNDISEQDITVLDYISLGFASKIDYFSSPSVEQFQKIVDLCEKHGIQRLLKQKVKQLSHGERQMVAVMRVLIQNPAIVIFDEPTAALDLKNQKELLALMIQLKEQGKIVIQISHNPNHALQVGGRTLLLFQNRIVYGDTETIITAEMLSELYNTDIVIETVKGKKFVVV